MRSRPCYGPGDATRAASEIDEGRLAAELRALGLGPGGVVLTHASLRSLGRVRGGSNTVVRALRETLGPDGTLVVPTFTPENSDTSSLYRQRIRGMTEQDVTRLRLAMPPYDPQHTPAPSMGRLAEHVRTLPGAVRSSHPQTSFAAVGPLARRIVSGHAPDCHLGERSPLSRLYEESAQVLLLGVGFARCTAFHLAEYLLPDPPTMEYHCVIRRGGERTWWSYWDVAFDDSDFEALGRSYERSGAPIRSGRTGATSARLLPLRAAVDHAVEWMGRHRPGHGG